MKVTFEQAPKHIDAAARKVIKHHVYRLRDDIVHAWPIKSGRSKAGWKVHGHRSGHTIANHVVSPKGYDYVPQLWVGLPLGSKQLPNGGDPIVQRRWKLLRKDLKRMKLA